MRGQQTVLDLPHGFRALDPVSVLEIRDARGHLLYQHQRTDRQAIPAPQAFQITHILSDQHERSLGLGPGNNLEIGRPVAAKTGTAGDPRRDDIRRDFWTVGYTPDLVTGVWVGNADNSAMTGGFSSRTAGLIWHDFMIAAHAGLPPRDFSVPAGVAVADRTHFGGIDYSCRTRQFEVFVEGGVPPHPLHLCGALAIDVRTLLLAGTSTPPEFTLLSYESPLRAPPSAPDSGPATLGARGPQAVLPPGSQPRVVPQAGGTRPATRSDAKRDAEQQRHEAGRGATSKRQAGRGATSKRGAEIALARLPLHPFFPLDQVHHHAAQAKRDAEQRKMRVVRSVRDPEAAPAVLDVRQLRQQPPVPGTRSGPGATRAVPPRRLTAPPPAATPPVPY